MIYKLVCNDPEIHNIYVGSTTNWTARMTKHKSSCNNPLGKAYNQKKYRIIRLNGGWYNWSMVLIEYYPCSTMCEAVVRERYYKELLNSDMNMQTPGAVTSIGREEYYRRSSAEYWKKHREEIRRKHNTKFQCECGGCYTYVNKLVHFATAKHQHYLNQFNYYWEDGTPCTVQEYFKSLK
jgi:predicted GIY-YIG superfamily endonuclease